MSVQCVYLQVHCGRLSNLVARAPLRFVVCASPACFDGHGTLQHPGEPAGHTGLSQPMLYAVYLPNRYGSPKLRAFVEFLAEKIGDPPFWDRGLSLA